MEIARYSPTLRAKAVAVLLATGVVTAGVLTTALARNRDLVRQRVELTSLAERETDLQQRLVLAVNLLTALSRRGPGPWDEPTPGQLRAGLAGLAAAGASTPQLAPAGPDPAPFRAYLADLEEILSRPAPSADLQDFTARLVPVLQSRVAQVQSALGEVGDARARLVRQYQRDAEVGARWMVAVGLGGFMVICLLAARLLLRLSRDLRRLEQHIERIARGGDGEPLDLGRGDEVGELARTLEQVAGALAEREAQLSGQLLQLPQSGRLATLGAFAAGIAHEIANPIHAIRGLCRHMTARLSDGESERNAAEDLKGLEMVLEQTERVERAVQDLRELALPGRDRMEPTSINLALESALGLLRYDRRFRGIEVVADLSPAVPAVHAAAEQLTQVAVHLLMNAAGAVGDGGKITVTSRPEGDGVLVTIEDNGRGMSVDHSRIVLAPPFATESDQEDTGIGLAICKAIIDRHGGSLQIESDRDRGTTVCICIPAPSEVVDR